MLIKVKRLDFTGSGYAPIAQDALINTDSIVTSWPADQRESRRAEPCTSIRTTDGYLHIILGPPEQLLAQEQQPCPFCGRKLEE